MIGKYCVIRTFGAGVHCGVLAARCGTEVALTDARRIWHWEGANTIHEIALHGVDRASQVSEAVPAIVLPLATEVVPCSPEGEKSLRGAKWSPRR